MVEQTERTHIREKLCHQLRHPGCALDLKTKDLIGQNSVSFSDH